MRWQLQQHLDTKLKMPCSTEKFCRHHRGEAGGMCCYRSLFCFARGRRELCSALTNFHPKVRQIPAIQRTQFVTPGKKHFCQEENWGKSKWQCCSVWEGSGVGCGRSPVPENDWKTLFKLFVSSIVFILASKLPNLGLLGMAPPWTCQWSCLQSSSHGQLSQHCHRTRHPWRVMKGFWNMSCKRGTD